MRGWETESFQSVACVMWKPMSTNVYRVGHKGKVCSLYTYRVPYFITELPGSVKVARLETFSSSHLFLGTSAVFILLVGTKSAFV